MKTDARFLRVLFEEGRALSQHFWDRSAETVAAAARDLAEVLRGGGKILAFGNGGSASQAQHFADELVNRFERERPGIAAVALNANTSSLTSIGNDRTFVEVFSRQVEALGKPGDAVVAFTTSGTSPNVVRAVEAARARGMKTVALLGRHGGVLRGRVDHPLVVHGENTARIQEVHLEILHALCLLLEEEAAVPPGTPAEAPRPEPPAAAAHAAEPGGKKPGRASGATRPKRAVKRPGAGRSGTRSPRRR